MCETIADISAVQENGVFSAQRLRLLVSDAVDSEVVKMLMSAASTEQLRAQAMKRRRSLMAHVLSHKIVFDSHVSVPASIPKMDGHIYRRVATQMRLPSDGSAALISPG